MSTALLLEQLISSHCMLVATLCVSELLDSYWCFLSMYQLVWPECLYAHACCIVAHTVVIEQFLSFKLILFVLLFFCIRTFKVISPDGMAE